MDRVTETFYSLGISHAPVKTHTVTSNQSFTIIICFQERVSDLLSVLPNNFQKSFQVEDLLDSEKQIIHLLIIPEMQRSMRCA